ncbi:tape measure protein [Cupriavidus alkaliphilus]|uniref:tape measure protein n=1 Tax=Cupriavidus alkaliphilus TaxID=942866 RepID=UPI0016171A12|nr:tape measure protein [Cupriavidus alkaliphilus]MBB2918335.1 tape measure domain-containing protein [Cupriavidus alkaliphilus]
MNVIRELVTVLRYEEDNSGLSRYQATFRNGMAKLRAGARNVREFGAGFMEGARDGLREITASQQALNAAQVKGEGSADKMAQGYRSIARLVRSIVAGFSVLSAAKVADDWASVDQRVRFATSSAQEHQRAMSGIYAAAQAVNQDFVVMADGFQTVNGQADRLGLSMAKSLALTKAVAQAAAISGGTLEDQAASVADFTQGLATGTIRWNSVLRKNDRLAGALADSFGVSVDQLKKMAGTAKWTGKQVAGALLKQADKLEAEYAQVPKTFSGSMMLLKNALGRQIDAFNRGVGAARAFAVGVGWIANNLQDVMKVLTLIGASAALATMRTQLLSATKASTLLQAAMVKLRAVSIRALWPFLRMAAILASVYLIGQDIWVWLQGGDSVMGELIGPAEKWRDTLDSIKAKLEWIKVALGGMGQELGPWLAKWGVIATLIVGLGGPLLSIVKLAFSFGQGIFWVVRGVAMLVSGLAAIVGWPALLAAAAIAAVIALGVYIYTHWGEIKKWGQDAWASITKSMGEFYDQAITWIKGVGSAITTWISDKLANLPITEWIKGAGAWVGNKVFGVGAADVQRVHPAGGGVTIQNNIAGVQVTAPNSSPAAIAAATERGISSAVSPSRMSRAAAALPMVEAGA